jgi:hypothetical protein
MEAVSSSETSVLIRATRRNIPEDAILNRNYTEAKKAKGKRLQTEGSSRVIVAVWNHPSQQAEQTCALSTELKQGQMTRSNTTAYSERNQRCRWQRDYGYTRQPFAPSGLVVVGPVAGLSVMELSSFCVTKQSRTLPPPPPPGNQNRSSFRSFTERGQSLQTHRLQSVSGLYWSRLGA